jgi:hypothetical protein
MSGATEAVIFTSMSSAGGASGATALFSTLSATGGVAIAGAAIYLAARKMRSDYNSAFAEYQGRADRESIVFGLQNASFIAAQQKAIEMSLTLSQEASDDPNTAFFVNGLSRLRALLTGGGPDGTGPTIGAEILLKQCDDLLTRVAAGDATGQFAAYEQLSQAVALHRAETKSRDKASTREQIAQELVNEQVAGLYRDLEESILAGRRHSQTRSVLLTRLKEIEALSQQPMTALQAVSVLRDRVRGEIRSAGEDALKEARNATRMRELVGQISAHVQAVLRQDVLEAPKAEAESLLKRVSVLVAATPVELAALEVLATEAQQLFVNTEQLIEEAAMASYLEDQVAQVLGGLGYRVTAATNGQSESKMVAVLDSGLGVQLNINGQGHLSGEMVAFSDATSDVNSQAQEKVCNLMDDIFDGLRRRNLVVREKKRKNLKSGVDRVPVVQVESASNETTPTSESKPLTMSLSN